MSRASSSDEALELIRKAFSSLPVTVLLYGSRARAEATALSDYDLLVVDEGGERTSPSLPQLPARASVFRIPSQELERLAKENSVVLAALLEGVIIVDNLGLAGRILRLRERLLRGGAVVTRSHVRFARF